MAGKGWERTHRQWPSPLSVLHLCHLPVTLVNFPIIVPNPFAFPNLFCSPYLMRVAVLTQPKFISILIDSSPFLSPLSVTFPLLHHPLPSLFLALPTLILANRPHHPPIPSLTLPSPFHSAHSLDSPFSVHHPRPLFHTA